jgi:site-specific DNA-methyltransferase (adenine-specific)
MQLIHGDCLEKMKDIPDKSIDMILCDLPYGTTACKWDVVIPFEPLWEQYKRIIKDRGAIVLFGSEPFSSYLRMSNIRQYKHDWVWDKHIPRGFQTAKYRPMNRHENILVFGYGTINYYPIMVERDKPVKVKNYSKKGKTSSNDIGKYNDSTKLFVYTHRNPDTIINGLWEANAGKVHPTQKPVALLEYLIKTYTLEGETVLDNCMGSGSAGIACINTKRNFIGIEKDDKYFEIAKKRIKEHLTTAST